MKAEILRELNPTPIPYYQGIHVDFPMACWNQMYLLDVTYLMGWCSHIIIWASGFVLAVTNVCAVYMCVRAVSMLCSFRKFHHAWPSMIVHKSIDDLSSELCNLVTFSAFLSAPLEGQTSCTCLLKEEPFKIECYNWHFYVGRNKRECKVVRYNR